MDVTIETVYLIYNGKKVKARKLTVSSEVELDINKAWSEVQKSALLEFVCKGKVVFKPIDTNFPKYWEEDMVVKTKLLIYGFLPFGGIHTLKFKRIDSNNFRIVTEEKDAVAKIWNHEIYMEKIDDNRIKYTDKIELYAGIFTGLMIKWVASFYKHRQKRWKIRANEIKATQQ